MAKKYKCRVEYLESTGTQWIDTGIAPSNITPIAKLKFIPTQQYSSGNYGIFGCFGANNTRFQIFYNSIGIGTYVSKAWQANNTYEVELNGKIPSATINGSVETSGYSTANGFSSDNMYLFTRNNLGIADSGIPLKLYYCKILDNGTLVRDFIPVLDLSGKPAMYDQVSGKLFYNQGTGEFTYGRQIIPVEYLQSTGTQYIDTGFKGKNNLHYKTKVNFTTLSTSGSNGIGGEYLANASAYIGMVRANGHYTYLFNNTAVETTTTIYANTDYEIDSVMNSGSQVLKVNGETISNGTLPGTFTSTRNIFLYAVCSTNDVADVYGSLKMYYCQIYDNDTLVRDFIPCIDENLTPFMFDKVNCTVYLNAGTGQFKVGPNVEKVWSGKKLRRKLALALANLKKPRKYYCEIEYLETTNQQSDYTSTNAAAYIDTGIVPDNNTKMECRMQFTTLISGQSKEALNGTTSTGQETAPRFAWGFASLSPYTNFYFGLGAQNLTTSVTRDTNVHLFVLDAKNKTCSIDNTTNSFTSSGSVDSTRSIYLFARHAGVDYANKPCNAKIYFCKIYDNETIVRDFIPVLDWNYVPCLYDKVSGQLFYSQGTEEFTAGREIHYVDYLESTGTQYINTGLLSTASSTVDTEFSFTSMESGVANNVGVFGGRNYTTTNTFTFFKIASGNPQYFRFDYNSQTTVGTASEMTWNTASKYRFQYNGTNCITTNTTTGESITTPKSPASTFTTNPICLFAVNTGGAIGLYLSGRIYYYKYSDGTKSVDMVPAIDENGVGFMLDRVSHTCYLNSGTGSFKYSAREVEYLESTGTQYINTGYKAIPATTKFELDFTPTTVSGNSFIFGARPDTSAGAYTMTTYKANAKVRQDCAGVSSYFTESLTTTGKYTFTAYNNTVSLNNESFTGTVTRSTTRSDYDFLLFTVNTGGTVDNRMFVGKVYSGKLWDNGAPVRDFVPSYKDGVACMVDKLTGTAYLNQGTGTFTTGKIVEPKYE